MTISSSGNIKRIYLAASAVVIVVLVYQITREDALLQPNQQLEHMLAEQPLITDHAINLEFANANRELERAQQALRSSAVKSTPVFEPARGSKSTMVVPDAWSMADANSTTPSMLLPGAVSIYEPVSVDMENRAYPGPGQQTSVTLPGGERLQVTVETGITNPNGDYTWRGHLDGHGDEYPVVMTHGSNSVFATVTTPSGSYTLESVNGSGWIYKNPSEFELSNPGANDFLEIPHDHD